MKKTIFKFYPKAMILVMSLLNILWKTPKLNLGFVLHSVCPPAELLEFFKQLHRVAILRFYRFIGYGR